mgnify:CR=1 FL=1
MRDDNYDSVAWEDGSNDACDDTSLRSVTLQDTIAGAGLGSWSATDSNGSFIYVAGDIGIEYHFDEAPIVLSLDYRPEFGGHGYFNNNYGSDIALAIKYKF